MWDGSASTPTKSGWIWRENCWRAWVISWVVGIEMRSKDLALQHNWWRTESAHYWLVLAAMHLQSTIGRRFAMPVDGSRT